MVSIIRSITNLTPYTLTLKIPGIEQNLTPVTIAPSATLDLLSVITEDDLISMQDYLNGLVSRGSLSVATTLDTSTLEEGYTGSSTWGNIGGSLSDQTDLQTSLNAKLPLAGGTITGSLGLGESPDPSAILDVASTTKGFLPPRMTTAQRNAIVSPAEGLTIYNSEDNQINYFDGSIWIALSTGSGNTPGSTNGAVQFNNSGTFGGDDANFFWDDLNNRLGIGTNVPSVPLHVVGNVLLNGQIDVNSHKIVNVINPTSAQDVATKNYVDTAAVPTSRTVSTTSPIIGGGDLSANRTLSIPAATNSVDGYLTAVDHTTFNNKQSALTFGNLTDVGTDGIVVTGGTGSVIGSGISISQHVADGSHNGYLSSTDWTTFNAKQSVLTFGNISTSTSGVTVNNGTNSTVGPNVTVDIQNADGTHTGLLLSSDWMTFNNKQNALTEGNLTEATSSVLTILGGINAVIGTGTSIQVKKATTSVDGYLSATDFTTFNNKQPAGSYITALTGDVTASGPGSSVATISNLAVTATKIASNTITNTQVASGIFSNVTGIGTQSQALNMNSHLIYNVTDPVSAQDAATKNYIDNNFTSKIASIGLTSRNTDISSTPLFTPSATGTYQVSVYLVDTTASLSAGAVQANIIYMDDSGSQTYSTAPIALTTLGTKTNSTFYIEATSGNVVSYSTSHTGIFSTSTYSIYIAVVRLS